MSSSFERSGGWAAGRMRRLVYELRTEAGGPAREATAIGVGAFIGCSPFYGFHLLICILAGKLLRLNRLKLYLAANVSVPLVAPFLIFAELQTGAWIRRGQLHPLTIETVRGMDPWSFGADILVGSAIVGGILGVGAGLATYFLTRSGSEDPFFMELVRRASERFVAVSLTAWEFARGKLRGDPIYRLILEPGVLPSGGTLVDVGCGSGLTLALLAEVRATVREGRWPDERPRPPVFDSLTGIELRDRVARMAQRALAGDATIVSGDARSAIPPACRAVLLFDVLHMMPKPDQEALIGALSSALAPDGIMVVREADAAAGWRFTAVRFGNGLKAIVFGHWRQTFAFRSADEWTSCFESLGFDVATRGAGDGTPFGNVVLTVRARRAATA